MRVKRVSHEADSDRKRPAEERTSAFKDSEEDSHSEELAEVLDPRRTDSDDSEAEAELERGGIYECPKGLDESRKETYDGQPLGPDSLQDQVRGDL